jgi:hypothetical protein
MMRIILANILFFVAVSFASAQLSIDPGCLALEADNVDQIYMDINITNSGNETTSVVWEFEPAPDFPADWKFQICDLNLCYDWNITKSSTSSFLINNLIAGETSKFTIKVHNTANTEDEMFPISGSSYGTLKLYDNTDFVDAIIETSCTVSNKNVDIEDLVIYPNPTTDVFQIKNDANVSMVSIYNIVGRQISTLNHTQGMVHDVSNLRAGMYLVRLENQNGEVVKAMRLSKR